MRLLVDNRRMDPNWIPSGGKTIHEQSAAYRAYIKLLTPPAAAPVFELDENDYPIVTVGEIFCLWEHRSKGHCGYKATSPNHLHRHLQRVHGCLEANRPKTSHKKQDVYERARHHYTRCMRDDDYEGKLLEEAPGSENPQMTTLNGLVEKRRRRQQQEAVQEETLTAISSEQSFQPQSSIGQVTPESAPNPSTDNVIAIDSEDEDGLSEIKTENIDSTTSALQTNEQKVTRSTTSPRLHSSRLDLSEAGRSRVMAPTPISIDSDSEAESKPLKLETREFSVEKEDPRNSGVISDDEDLELEVEEAEARLQLIAAKRKLMARKKRRQERG